MSPNKHTFVTDYTNENEDAGHPPMEEGNIGYAPTADQLKGEAYEDMWTQLSPEW